MAIKLTKKRAAWAKPRDATLKGTPLTYSAAAPARYEKDVNKLIRSMRAEYQREIMKLLRNEGVTTDANAGSQARMLFSWLGKKWAQRFSKQSTRISEKMVSSIDKDSSSKLGESLKKISGGLTINVPDMPASMAEVMKASIAENVSLIRSIQSQYQEKLEGIVYRSIQSGGRGAADIYDELIKAGEMSERRAHLIAVDQSRKATSAFNAERAKSVGIKKGIWHHSSGSANPREKHLAFDGKEFNLNDPPAIGDNGEKVMPGQEIHCKCFWSPVVDFDAL